MKTIGIRGRSSYMSRAATIAFGLFAGFAPVLAQVPPSLRPDEADHGVGLLKTPRHAAGVLALDTSPDGGLRIGTVRGLLRVYR